MKSTLLASPVAAALLTACGSITGPVIADDRPHDFGMHVERLLHAQSAKLFGFEKPLRESAPATRGTYRTLGQSTSDQILLAHGLKAEYLTRDAADLTDMMAFYPILHPTHLMTCVEGNRAEIAPGKFNPSVQRINLTTGQVETLLRGMSGCDGIRVTPWGTLLVTEERSDGSAYEIIDPLNVTNQTVINRDAGTLTDPAHIAKRTALPVMAWEGLMVLPNGVIIAGDELRPGTATANANGGAIFKFIPQTPRTDTAHITHLADSPLVAGNVYTMQVSCVHDKVQSGQGCEVGNAAWLPVDAAMARASADAKGATGYYRPEDLHQDLLYNDPTKPNAVRFCWTNTGNENAGNYAEVICGIDSEPLTADASKRSVVVNRFIEGDSDFNSFDNLDFQPGSGNLYVVEDHPNGDIFACLPDGADRDIKTDGCVRMLSVKDSSAEPTGFIFSSDGTTAYVSIQHSDDTTMPTVDDYGTDDIIKITGFKGVKKP